MMLKEYRHPDSSGRQPLRLSKTRTSWKEHQQRRSFLKKYLLIFPFLIYAFSTNSQVNHYKKEIPDSTENFTDFFVRFSPFWIIDSTQTNGFRKIFALRIRDLLPLNKINFLFIKARIGNPSKIKEGHNNYLASYLIFRIPEESKEKEYKLNLLFLIDKKTNLVIRVMIEDNQE
jgi:hypothetical protein